MADEMPRERKIRGLRDLLRGFLHFVLAKIDLTASGGGADVIGGEGFRDGDEADGGGVAPGPAGGARDTFTHAGQPCSDRGGVDHYFLYCATIALAVAAFGPSGVSFR